MSNDVSATDLSVASDLTTPEQTPAQADSVPKRVPVEVVFADTADDTAAPEPKEQAAPVVVQTDVTPTDVTPTAEATNSNESALAGESASEDVTESPGEVVESTEPEINPFEELGLSPAIVKSIAKAGYESPSPIQAQTVSHILAGRDMMGQAETGSGKTAAFAWPTLSNIDLKKKKPQVLILAPTRELAIQVTRSFEKYATELKGFKAVTIYGGQSYDTQIRALERGVHVVAGTPGRVMDHLRRGTLKLNDVDTFILDEADEMLRMGFIDDVEWILEQIPAKRQILTFSATLPEPIQRIAQKHLDDPVHVAIKGKTATAGSIEQSCVFLHAREKQKWLTRFLDTEETEGVLVFVKTRQTTMVVSERLIQHGIIASALNGDIAQNQRERTVNQLKSGRINVVVATDVAARGLDVERISHVINYDFPHDTEAYVHRIGRTGRAGRKGRAIMFVEPKEKGKLSRLQRATNQRIDTFKERSIDDINAMRVSKFKQRVVDATSNKQVKFFAKLLEELQTESGLSVEDMASALAVMAQGDKPLLLNELAKAQSNWKKNRDNGRGQGRDRGPMKTFRVEVGRSHGLGPGNIVGAVTNEADLDNSMIGRINIFNDFSTIDLPADIPADLIDHLRGVMVSGQRLDIKEDDRKYSRNESRGRGGRGGHSGSRNYRRSNSGDRKPWEKKPWDKKGRGGKSYGNKSNSSNDKPSYDKSSSDRKPYKKKSADEGSSSYSERKPKSNSGSSKSGGSKFGYSKFENAEFKSERYSKSKSGDGAKKSRPKTKAAQRTKAKRKPGAKISGPVKKYVKIRSAK